MTKFRSTLSVAAVCLLTAACSSPQAVTEAKTPQSTPAAKAAPAPAEPAKEGLTIEQIWKSREALAGKRVVVRGKVVKFNGGILGVNWIHLQDGTGSADAHTNDITITSDAEASVGDVVTVTGVIQLNKDLGSGYNYPVIIEKARIERALNAR